MDPAPTSHDPPGTTGDAALLAAYLAERDVPCPACGYNLRGLKAQACPECTQPPVLGLHRHGIPARLCVLLSVACAMHAASVGLSVVQSVQGFVFNRRQAAAGTLRIVYSHGETFTVWVPTAANSLLTIAFLCIAPYLYRSSKPHRAQTRATALLAFAWAFGAGALFHLVFRAIAALL